LSALDGAAVPLLVFRVRELQRIAWRDGRPAARRVERQCWRGFVAGAGQTLRAGDVLGHARDSEDFLAALVSRARRPGTYPSSLDCRAALRRIGAALSPPGGPDVESGWTTLHGSAAAPELRRAIERALENGVRERERYAFFSTIGHELRTPLTSVRGYVDALLDGPLDPATTRRYLETARAETLRMSRLVEGMFDISLLDLRGAVASGERAALGRAVEAARAAVAATAQARGCTLALATGPGLEAALPAGLEVALGADVLVAVLINLLDNAIKHGRARGRVELSVKRHARHVELFVDDDGPGVVPEEREEIFALGRRSSSASAAGTGIGLAFVRMVLERSGGSIEALAGPLGGARFRLCLPLPPG
jgi:signal transduction histidine kinase